MIFLNSRISASVSSAFEAEKWGLPLTPRTVREMRTGQSVWVRVFSGQTHLLLKRRQLFKETVADVERARVIVWVTDGILVGIQRRFEELENILLVLFRLLFLRMKCQVGRSCHVRRLWEMAYSLFTVGHVESFGLCCRRFGCQLGLGIRLLRGLLWRVCCFGFDGRGGGSYRLGGFGFLHVPIHSAEVIICVQAIVVAVFGIVGHNEIVVTTCSCLSLLSLTFATAVAVGKAVLLLCAWLFGWCRRRSWIFIVVGVLNDRSLRARLLPDALNEHHNKGPVSAHLSQYRGALWGI